MRTLVLHFVGDSQIELFETLFNHPRIGTESRCIRGKRSGAFRDCSTFQWTRAVQAMSVLMLEAVSRTEQANSEPLLIGMKGSLASSLDYAIDKQTRWLYDMFGWDGNGTGLSRRLFIRSNPGQRIPGPVALSLNLNYLGYHEIVVHLNYERITNVDTIATLKQQIVEGAKLSASQMALAA